MGPARGGRPGSTREAFELHLDRLGSGSDYTAFLDHLGVPSLDFGFGGPYGVYHAVYDDFRWTEKFGDPEFLYHAAAARFYGLLAMRLAAADVVPLRFGSYARALQQDLDDLRREVVHRNRKPRAPDSSDKLEISPDFGAVVEAVKELGQAGEEADRAVESFLARPSAPQAARISDGLMQVERAFLSESGLPGRPWFRHLLIAPGTTTGYAAWPFPSLTQAVEDRDAQMFESEAKRVVTALKAGTARLREVTALAKQP